MTQSEIGPEELLWEVRDVLLCSEPHQGGCLGRIRPEHREQVMMSMRAVGHVGPGGHLTARGAAAARRVQGEEWG